MFWIKAPSVGKRGVSKVTNYLVQVGDHVEAGQAIADIETDKVSHELQTPVSGIVRRIFWDVNLSVDAGTPLVEIEPETAVEPLSGPPDGTAADQTD